MQFTPKGIARLWPKRFSAKVMILSALLIFSSLISLTSYLILEISEFHHQRSEEMLTAISSNMSANLSNLLITHNYGEIEQLLLQAANYPGIKSISVIDSKGRPISTVKKSENIAEVIILDAPTTLPNAKTSSYTWSHSGKTQGNIFALGLDATELAITQPIEDGALGWLKISLSVEDFIDDAIHLIRDILLYSLIILIVAIWLLHKLLRPNLQALENASKFARSLILTNGQQISKLSNSLEIRQFEQALNETSQHLYQQENALISANALLQNVLNAASEVSIIATDYDGVITLFNTGAEKLLECTAFEMVGKQSLQSIHLHPEIQARSIELSEKYGYAISGFLTLVEIANLHGAEQREWTYLTRSGRHIPVSQVITPMYSDGQKITGYLAISQDITERKRIDQMKSEFVSTVSHELRTPLTSISGALGLIEGGALGAIPEGARQMISIAHKNSLRLTFLINDLLDMEKLVAGKMHFNMQIQLLLPLIEQSIEGNRTYAIERGIKMELLSSIPDIEVNVDNQRLLQVMSNLLSNAIKYSPDNNTVSVHIDRHGQYVRVGVHDNGSGIPEEFKNRIFKKFSQADSSDTRQKGGTGLGLAITRELIQRMGGKISFVSDSKTGTTFYFDLPIEHTPNFSIPSVKTNETDSAKNILIIEDEADIAKLLAIMLERAGYKVDIAYQGQQALDALQNKQYDAITLDLMLPDISGLELIQRIRSNPDSTTLPIIVVSAKMEEGKIRLNGGFTDIDWLTKPIDESKLLQALQQILPLESESVYQVLHVEDDTDLHQVIRAISGKQYHFTLAKRLRHARELLANTSYDLIILDLTLPDGSAWELLAEIRAGQSQAKVIILSGTEINSEEASRVEAVLLKSLLAPKLLLDTLNQYTK